MNIPSKIKIGWREYEVKQGEHRSGCEGGDLYGEIRYGERTIWLYEKQSEEEKAVTLLHEVMHGIFNMCGREDNQKDEGLITALSENLYQVFKDNPQLFEKGANYEY